MKKLPFLYISLIYKLVNSQMESFVVGGSYTNIIHYPHSIYLNIACDTSVLCGGSILNQNVVLTAAHCLENCTGKRGDSGIIKYGHEHLMYMESTKVNAFRVHDNYDEETAYNDICILTCKKPIKLGNNVKRVIIMKYPPTDVFAHIAGWGVTNKHLDFTTKLKHTSQKIQPAKVCNIIGPIHEGSFCAGPVFGVGNPDQGDSGSALVIKSYIQIGLVSYKVEGYSLVVYTNISYYYDWISKQARRLHCLY